MLSRLLDLGSKGGTVWYVIHCRPYVILYQPQDTLRGRVLLTRPRLMPRVSSVARLWSRLILSLWSLACFHFPTQVFPSLFAVSVSVPMHNGPIHNLPRHYTLKNSLEHFIQCLVLSDEHTLRWVHSHWAFFQMNTLSDEHTLRLAHSQMSMLSEISTTSDERALWLAHSQLSTLSI